MEKIIQTLIVDDDEIVRDFFAQFLRKENSQLFFAQSKDEAEKIIKKQHIDIAFIDLNLGTSSGIPVIQTLRDQDPNIPVVVISSTSLVKDAIESFRLGIFDFLQKPIQSELLIKTFQRAQQRRTESTQSQLWSEHIQSQSDQLLIGDSKAMQDLRNQIRQLKGVDIDVLVLGESGTGKEVVAKSLYQQEQNNERPYVTLNCSAVPKELMESVLFGHEKGSFTGAFKKQIGKFELAHGGDIFLDEIGTLSHDLQAKLLRVLQEREIEPIGAGIAKKLQFRVVAATNAHLEQMVQQKEFRMDLLFRLNKVILMIPPLRDRAEDIPILANHFLKKHKRGSEAKELSPEAMALLQEQAWPGNVRELENVIENLIITTSSKVIQPEHVRKYRFMDPTKMFDGQTQTSGKVISDGGVSVDMGTIQSLDQLQRVSEKMFIRAILKTSSSRTEAADKMGIDRKTLQKKMETYGLDF